MADVYQKIVEILDNSAYIAALKKAEDEEKTLAALRTAGGTAAVKALRETEKAQQQQAKEAAKAAAAEMAAEQKKSEYLERLRIQSYKDEQKAAERAEREAKKAAAGPSAWTLSLQANTKALAEQHGAINKAKEATGALGAALSLVSPELATIASGFQKAEGAAGAMAGAAEILGSSLGAVAVAAGPVLAVGATLGYMWHEQAEYQKEVAKRTEDYAEALRGLKKAMADLNDQADDLDTREGLLTGEYTKQEAAAERAKNAALKATQAQRDASKQELQALQDRLAAIRVAEREGGGIKGIFAGPSSADLARESQDVERQIKTLTDGLDELDKKALAVADTEVKVTEGEEKHKDAVKASTKATKDANEAAREAARLKKEEQDAISKARKQLYDEAEERKKFRNDERQQEAERIAALEAAGDAREAQFIKDQAMEEERLKRQQAMYMEMAGYASSYASSVSSIFETVAENRARAAENGTKAEKEAALKAWKHQQAAAEAEALINTALAVSKASTVAPPPFNLIAMGAALAEGVAQEVAINSAPAPQFEDTPTVQTPRGDGQRQQVSLAADDFWMASKTTQGMIGQLVNHLTRQQGAPPRSSMRPVAGDLLSFDPVRLYGRDLPLILRGGAR